MFFQAEMFIGLLLRAMKSDVNLKRVSAFTKRVLQVSDAPNSLFACSFCLLMLRKKTYKDDYTSAFHFTVIFFIVHE